MEVYNTNWRLHCLITKAVITYLHIAIPNHASDDPQCGFIYQNHQLMAIFRVNLDESADLMDSIAPFVLEDNCRRQIFSDTNCTSCHPTNGVKSLKGTRVTDPSHRKYPLVAFFLHPLWNSSEKSMSL